MDLQFLYSESYCDNVITMKKSKQLYDKIKKWYQDIAVCLQGPFGR